MRESSLDMAEGRKGRGEGMRAASSPVHRAAARHFCSKVRVGNF